MDVKESVKLKVREYGMPLEDTINGLISQRRLITAYGKYSDDRLYVVLAGKLSGETESGDTFSIETDYRNGIEILGERGIDSKPRTASIFAEPGTIVYSMNPSELKAFMQSLGENELSYVIGVFNANVDRWAQGLSGPNGLDSSFIEYCNLRRTAGAYDGEEMDEYRRATLKKRDFVFSDILWDIAANRPNAGEVLALARKYSDVMSAQDNLDMYNSRLLSMYADAISQSINLGFSVVPEYANKVFGLHNYSADSMLGRILGRHAEIDFAFNALTAPDAANILDWHGFLHANGIYSLSRFAKMYRELEFSLHISSQINIPVHAETSRVEYGWLQEPKAGSEENRLDSSRFALDDYKSHIDAAAHLRKQGIDISVVSMHVTKAGLLIDGAGEGPDRNQVLKKYITDAVSLRSYARERGLTLLIETGGLRSDQVTYMIDEIHRLEGGRSPVLLYDPSHAMIDIYEECVEEKTDDATAEAVKRMNALHTKLLTEYKDSIGAAHISQITVTEDGYADIHRPLAYAEKSGDPVIACLDSCIRDVVRFSSRDRPAGYYLNVETAPTLENMRWLYNQTNSA